MNKIINNVASEFDMPMKYENKTTNIFIDTQDMEERYAEGLYQDYLKEENNKLKKEKEDLQERVDKAINLIENGDLLYLASKCSTIYKDNIEIVAIYDRLRGLLEILKGSDK